MTGITGQSTTQAIRVAERKDLDGTRTGTKPRLNAKAAGNSAKPGASSGHSTQPIRNFATKETIIQRRMRLIQTGRTPPQERKVSVKEVGATKVDTEEKSEDLQETTKPGSSKGQPEETRQTPRPQSTHENMVSKEMRTMRRNLSYGLSGTRVKRYWRMVNEGVPCEEARRKAMAGYTPRPDLKAKSIILPRSASTKHAERQGKKAPPSKMTEIRLSYAKAVESEKMAVYAKETPAQMLSKDQLTWISEALLEAIIAQDEVKVKFEAVHFKPGTLGIDCTNKASADWLARTAPKLEGWEGPELCVSTADKAPKSTVVNIVFPRMGKKPVESIMKMVHHQNDGINTAAWKIIRQVEEGDATRIVAGIDDQSLKAIEAQGYTLSFRYGRVAVKLKRADEVDADSNMETEDTGIATANESVPPEENESSQTQNRQLVGLTGSPSRPMITDKDDLESDIETVEQMEAEEAQLSDELV